MKFRVIIVPAANSDLEDVLAYLSRHSLAGAATWYDRWLTMTHQLEAAADKCLLAPENEGCSYELRQLVFKTRRGKQYRVVFTIRDDRVYLLHLRGPGQNLIAPDEIREPPSP